MLSSTRFFVIKPFPILGICFAFPMIGLGGLLGIMITKFGIAVYESVKENKKSNIIQFPGSGK